MKHLGKNHNAGVVGIDLEISNCFHLILHSVELALVDGGSGGVRIELMIELSRHCLQHQSLSSFLSSF